MLYVYQAVVNCFQNLCIFASETTITLYDNEAYGCELLSKFVYICVRNNPIISK